MALSSPAQIAHDVAPDVVRRQLTGRKVDVAGRALQVFLWFSLALTVSILVVLVGSQVAGSSSVFDGRFGDFMSGTLRSIATDAGIHQGLRGTFWIGVIVVVVAFPLGIAAAVYIEEYAPKSRLTRFIDVNVRNLAGVPSVVFGILGLTVFVKALEGVTGGRSVIAGGITLAIMVLPIVIITSAEAIRAVPDSLREGGYGAGATRWEVVRTQILPYAAPGMLTGTVLSLARAMGEAAPLILVGAVSDRLGSDPAIFDISSLTERFTAMPNVITTWSGRPQEGFPSLTSAAIVVLLVIVLAANSFAILLRNRFEKKRR